MKTKSLNNNITIAIIPFILLIVIGLVFLQITYHLKVFKSLLIFISDVVLLFLFTSRILKSNSGIIKEKKYFLYFIIYFLFVFIQFCVSFFSGEASYDREYYLANYIFLIIFSVFVFLYLNDLKDIKIGLIIISIFFYIIFVWSGFELINFISKGGKSLSDFRPDLSFGNTNYFAGFLIGLLPLGFITPFLWYKKENPKYFIIIFTAIGGVLGTAPLIFTQTKAAIFGWYIGLFVIFLPSLVLMINNLSWKIKIPIAGAIIFIFVAAPVLILLYQPHFIKIIFPRIVSAASNFNFVLNDRINAWAGGIGLFKDHPIFGAGSGTVYPASFKYINKYFYIYSDSNSFKHAHNEYVEVLGEAGLFGIILFVSLFGYIIFSLLKKVYSNKYTKDYRLICLGVCSGIISMLILQIFCLSLRMSVTMSAYFFLLGLSIFLISYSKKAIIESKNFKKEIKNNNSFIDGYLNKSQSNIFLLIITLFIIIGFALFLPLYRSERNIINFMNADNYDNAKSFILKAINAKPDNVYAWTKKYEFDNDFIRIAKSGEEIESTLDEIKKDLDKLDSIIPGYQENWSKIARYYIQKYQYYNFYKYQKTSDLNDFDEAKKSQKEAFNYLNKSLNMNFLRLEDHVYRLIFLNISNDNERRVEAIKDYFTAKIYVDFCRTKKIIKEKVIIVFDDGNSKLVLKNGIYNFNISMSDISRTSKDIYGYKEIKDFNTLQDLLNREIDSILVKLY